MSSISPSSHFVPLEPYESLRILLAAIARRTDIAPEWQILRTKSILLHGPPQVGKTTLITSIASDLGIKVINVRPWRVVMDYQRGVLWPERALDSYFNEATKQPSILLIKGIEVLFPPTEMEGGGSNDTYYANALISQFLTHLDKLAADDTDAVVIGITNKIDSINPIVRSRFEDEIEVDGPTPTQRTQLLTQHINSICKMDNLQTQIDFSEIGSHTHGYLPGDIAALVRDAAMLALARTKQGEQLSLCTDDFVKTCKSHPPHNLSGLALQGIPKTTFDDIGGLQEVEDALKDIVVFANTHSEKLAAKRIRPPRGVLLYGPPGTGKTMLARAVANEAAANFISVNISDLSQAEVGESEKALKAIFRRANQSRPSVIFLDEVQALFTSRSLGKSNTLHSQLALELDNAAEGVLVLAATNCPSAIDEALLRPGRLHVALFIPPPTKEGRIAILSKALANVQADLSINVESIAEQSTGFTGADLHNLCNTAGLMAMREAVDKKSTERVQITQAHLEKVLQSTLPSVTHEMVHELETWQSTRKY